MERVCKGQGIDLPQLGSERSNSGHRSGALSTWGSIIGWKPVRRMSLVLCEIETANLHIGFNP